MSSNQKEYAQQETPEWLKAVQGHYAALANVATYKSGAIQPGLADDILDVQLVLSQRDLKRNIKRSISMNIAVQEEQSGSIRVLSETVPIESTEIAQQNKCSKTKRIAILRSSKDKEEKTRRFIEVWQSGQLVKNIEVTEQHDDFYNDVDTFGSLEWSADSSKLMYIAEKKATTDDRKKFEYQQTWGEKFDKRIQSCLVLVDLNTDVVSIIDINRNDIGPGQVRWFYLINALVTLVIQPLFTQDGQWIYFTGYIAYPRKFGMYACLNRPARIFRCRLDGSELEAVSSDKATVRSPRLSPDGHSVIYLEHPLAGPHAACSRLMKYHLTSSETTVWVDAVEEPHNSEFTGLYMLSLPSKCWIRQSNEDYLITATTWRYQTAIIAIHYGTGHVTRLTNNLLTSWSVLGAINDKILAVSSSPVKVNDLYVGTFTVKDQPAMDWTKIHRPHSEDAAKYLKTIKYSSVAFPERYYGIDVILVEPADHIEQSKTVARGDKPPLIMFPHGGPHGVNTTNFSAMTVALASLGFSVAMVNYRGSTGYGNKSIHSLIGKIGSIEIEDTQYMAEKLLETGRYDTKRVSVMGGSHGGFTSAHLIGQYPDFYQACVMRNPAINVGAMSFSTDIPDWCFSEMGAAYDFNRPPVMTPKQYEQAFSMSPISNVAKVITPTLMMLGDNDQRVPHSEGLGWVHAVRGLGKGVIQCHMYSNNGHALDGMEAETIGFATLAGWFLTYASAK
ncbi:Alpha/Beta hydrolase protein [Syncephalis fuscata]|nr:Alpha/Beta hydrolase protein [Syncephalis fuscata]